MAGELRGQTSIDFAIAMGVFLVALTTVVAFMPVMNQPFTDAQDDPLLADRLAAQITDDYLGEASEPSVLNTTCTMHFFNDTSATGSDPCRAFVHNDPIQTKVGVDSSVQVNVSLRRNESGDAGLDIVCATNDAETLTGISSCGGEKVMAVGPVPPSSAGSVTVARRFGLLGDEPVFVVVKVWS